MPDARVEGILQGDRLVLSRAITLVESNLPSHRAEARVLLDNLLPHTGRAMRLGISGPPGSGKSTLIEALGLHAIGAGHQVAVLAIDPSSARSGGSVLGDKTRMADLSRSQSAFVRPSPSSGTLGGVARRTREVMLLCEAAGFDVVIVETVGVGQSEVAVADLVDLFVLLAAPGGGDELQGIKRGIMELADIIVVNKADGDLLSAAQRAAGDLRHAVHLLRPKHPGWSVPVLLASSIEGRGIDELWDQAVEHQETLGAAGLITALRSAQGVSWMWSEISETLIERLRSHPATRRQLDGLEVQVADGRTSPTLAAHEVLRSFLGPGYDVPG